MKALRLLVAPTAGAVALVAVAYPALWLLARPSGEPTRRFIGEICGAEAVPLLSCTLVLATLPLRPVARATAWFHDDIGAYDRDVLASRGDG